uniref:Uncharacterized protein n=1 Tax=Molossus molossus TaxID=27622 RepID=A0A7J8EEV2_MOLMO|nr:hypothetical protein HJG59_008867 [Molossus molossus]
MTHLSFFVAVPRAPANSSSVQNEQSLALRTLTASECSGHLLPSCEHLRGQPGGSWAHRDLLEQHCRSDAGIFRQRADSCKAHHLIK